MKQLKLGLIAVALLVVVAVVASTVSPSLAGGRVFVGVGFGAPFWYPWPYAYPYPYPAYAPPVVVETQPQVYVQRDPGPSIQSSYWYYCQASQTYYPYRSFDRRKSARPDEPRHRGCRLRQPAEATVQGGAPPAPPCSLSPDFGVTTLGSRPSPFAVCREAKTLGKDVDGAEPQPPSFAVDRVDQRSL